MFLALIETILKWILKFCYSIEFWRVEAPKECLENTAENEIAAKLEKLIKIESEGDNVDAKTWIIPKTTKIHEPTEILEIPKSIYSYIEFDQTAVLQYHPELIFRGTFLKQKKVTIKKCRFDERKMKCEMRVAELMNTHASFLSYYFYFRQHEEYYIVMEYFDETLETLLPKPGVYFDVRDIFSQVISGVEYLHQYFGYVHRNLHPRNVAVTIRREKLICKITNFSAAALTLDFDFKQDFSALGNILLHVYDLRNAQDKMTDQKFAQFDKEKYWSSHDKILCVDLIELLNSDVTKVDQNTKEDTVVRPVSAHPFFWSPRDTLNFIVQFAKLFEKPDSSIFQSLRKISKKIIGSDWRGYVCCNVMQELDEINRKNLPSYLKFKFHPEDVSLRNDLVTLIKTIRNLVSILDAI